MGFFGGSVGWEKKWAAKPFKGGNWALCGSMGSEILYDSRWTSDMFELIFYGNGGHTGRVDVLSGTGMRMAEFNRFGLGFENTKTRQRFEVSLVQRLAGLSGVSLMVTSQFRRMQTHWIHTFKLKRDSMRSMAHLQ